MFCTSHSFYISSKERVRTESWKRSFCFKKKSGKRIGIVDPNVCTNPV